METRTDGGGATFLNRFASTVGETLFPPKSRLRRLSVVALLVLGVVVLGPAPAFAVNATGAFELDGNAVTDHAGAGAPDDWDRVCHQVLGTDCSTTNNTNGATAIEFASQTASNGTTFTGGGSKDPIDINSWAWNQGSGGLPGKDILLNGFAARYNLPASATTCPAGGGPTCSVVFFGMDRFDNSGDAQNAFWFFQNPIGLGTTKVGAGQTFTGVHKNGDLLVVSDFSIGGTISTITVYLWDSTCTAAGKPDAGCADANLRQLQTSSAANCATSSPIAAFCGIVNPVDGATAPWPFTDKTGHSAYQQGEFYEGGINLSLFPGLAQECFASTLAESRSSASTSAVLKSFVLGNFGSCSSSIVTTAKDGNGNPIPGGGLSIGAGTVSATDSATVKVDGALIWNGTVAFSLCGPNAGTCATGGTAISSQSVSNATSMPILSGAATLTSVGSYCWRADFTSGTSGVPDAHHNGTDANECFTVNPVTPSLATAAGAGPVLLGQAVTDTATLGATANQPGSPIINGPLGALAGGSITFTLVGPNDCTTTAAGTGTNPQSLTVGGNGTYGPVSFTPSAVGTYHWVASYSGSLPNTNPTTHNTACNDTGEDVIVRQLPTTTVTTPVDGSGTPVSSVSFGASVFDHAVVTGDPAGGTPTGTVNFFICNPTQVTGTAGSEVCAGGTALSGNPRTATAIALSNPPQSEATSSPAVIANQTGVWCFRATYTPDTSAYTGSSDGTHHECFTVTDTTSTSTAQDWLPNDSATITSGGSPLDGTVTFTLYSGGACTGTPLYTETPITVSGATAMPLITHNTTVKVTATGSTTVSWKVVYTSNNPNVSGSNSCEITTLNITN